MYRQTNEGEERNHRSPNNHLGNNRRRQGENADRNDSQPHDPAHEQAPNSLLCGNVLENSGKAISQVNESVFLSDEEVVHEDHRYNHSSSFTFLLMVRRMPGDPAPQLVFS